MNRVRALTAQVTGSGEVLPKRLDFASTPRISNYNPEWKPNGFEGAVDTHSLPWIDLPQMPGCSFKPLRVSRETGAFTIIMSMRKGTQQPPHVLLGSSDTFILTGKLAHKHGAMKGELGPGVWGYSPANAKMEGLVALEDTEYLVTYNAPICFLSEDGSVKSLLTGLDVMNVAYSRQIPLLPLTLEEAMGEKPATYTGPGARLACSWDAVTNSQVATIAELTNPHWVDTNALPWITNDESPGIAMKLIRVSTETGAVSLVVRHRGQASPHFHLGAADFIVTSGRIGYRAGPKEGYGAGTYFWEPAGARHEATQSIGDEELIYTANLYGPISFDSGVGTPVVHVQSWMQYLESGKAAKSPLLASTFPNDQTTLLAPGLK